MKKSDLSKMLAEKMGKLTSRQWEAVVDLIFDSMTAALKNGDKVEIRGFGSFTTRERRAKMGRNPKTGESVAIPMKRVPFFKTGKELKELVDNHRSATV